jgi:polysaccharide pyruvyl transferase CsaB
MKVLHLIGGGDVGGAKSHVLSLVKELDGKIDVKIVSFREGVFSEEAKELGINIEIVRHRNIVRDIKRVFQIIRDGKYDLVHSHGAKANMIALIVKKRLNIPNVTTVHSDYKLDYLNSLLKQYSFGIINYIAIKTIDNHIGVSKNFKRMLIKRNFDVENIFTLYNGICFKKDIKTQSKKEFLESISVHCHEKTVIVGILARLHPVKLLDVLLLAFKIVLENVEDAILIIGGEGEERKNLEKLAKYYQISDRVYMPGFVNNMDFLNAIDINLLTSMSESFPYVIMEGSLFEVPIISTDVGGISDLVIHGETGYLFQPGDHKKLSEYMIDFVRDEKKRKEFGKKLLQKASTEFSIENMRDKQLQIYHEVIDKSKFFKNNYERSKKYFDVIITGYYGFNNFGDDAMLLSIIEGLKNSDPYVRILVLSNRPVDTKLNYEINSIHRMNLIKMVKYMKKSKLLIYGGGNLIQDNTSTRSLIYYLTTILLAKMFRMNIMIYGNGIGPLKRTINKYFSGKILNLVDAITLREGFSFDFLEALKVKAPIIKKTADPAFLMKIDDSFQSKFIFHNENIDLNDKLVGFCIRNWSEKEVYIEKLAKAADYISERYQLVPIFIPMHFPKDSEIGAEIACKMKHKSYVIKNKYDIYQIIHIISKTEFLIGMRLHALILAVKLSIPVIGLSYEPKVTAFFKEIESDNILNIHDFTYDDFIMHINEVYGNMEPLKEKMKKQSDIMMDSARASQEIALELLSFSDQN